MSPSLANFFVETANFLLLAGGLGWLLFKPVRNALQSEQARHEAQTADAERARTEAEKLVDSARADRAAAQREAAAAGAHIVDAAKADAEKLLATARAARAEERREFEDELSARREEEAAALAGTVGRIAAESVSRVLERLGGPSLDVALVRAACEELQSIPVDARAKALVESAHPLPDEARVLLHRVLGGDFQVRTVDELQAGVRVTTARGQVDASLASLAREAERVVRRTAAGAPEPTHG